jgi:hypothetical protein
MNFGVLNKWVLNRIQVDKRLRPICAAYVLFVMIQARKHTQQEAARFWGINKCQLSRFLKNHSDLAVYTLSELSKKQARQFSGAIRALAGLPWKIAILIDSTLQSRSTLHTDNAQKLNHGKGFVIGHQWTNVVLVINGKIIPLPPIPLYSKNYCRDHGLEYKTENERVVEYLNDLRLQEYVGRHHPDEVIVLADSGYDDRKIENAIVKKKWRFIIALNRTRSVKSERQQGNTPKSKGWSQVGELFRNHRRIRWRTIRIPTNGPRTKRMEFRVRQIVGYLRHVGKAQLICSEVKKRPDGRRKYLACNDLKVKARQIIMGYRIRWSIEIFHKMTKMYMGFEDVAARHFKSVISHVHWVYCAYILLHPHPPGVPQATRSLPDIQRKIKEIIETKEKARVLQLLTQFKGVERYKNELRTAQTSG